jgi:hypothetical protein
MQSLMSSGAVPFARVEIESSEEWQTLASQQHNDAQADALLWLEELLIKL